MVHHIEESQIKCENLSRDKYGYLLEQLDNDYSITVKITTLRRF